MPTWLVPTLKWGGIGLAIVAAIAVVYVQFLAAPAPPEATAATDEAPMTSTGFCCWLASWRLLQGS
jgi:hypothetical protein